MEGQTQCTRDLRYERIFNHVIGQLLNINSYIPIVILSLKNIKKNIFTTIQSEIWFTENLPNSGFMLIMN